MSFMSPLELSWIFHMSWRPKKRGFWPALIGILLLPTHLISGAPQPSTLPELCIGSHAEKIELNYIDQPSQTVANDLENILSALSTSDHIDIWAADVKTASAVFCDGRKGILYSPSFFNNLENSTGSNWGSITVLAHEVGHHIQGHYYVSNIEEMKEMERQADRFSGMTLCKMGGDLGAAQRTIDFFEGRTQPPWPPSGARREALTRGWEDEDDADPCPSPLPRSQSLTCLPNLVEINSANAADWARKPLIAGSSIEFRDVEFKAEIPLILFADEISFDQNSTLHGADLTLIAKEIVGGSVHSDGGPGEDAGRIIVAAIDIINTTFSANGGDGDDGHEGQPGEDGKPGDDGQNMDCSRASGRPPTRGDDGKHGQSGEDGTDGEDGGRGGEVSILVEKKRAVLEFARGGRGGHGQRGGRGGIGGIGGRGGIGCPELQVLDAPNGAQGPDGSDGISGTNGQGGADGRIDLQELVGLRDLIEIVGECGSQLSGIHAKHPQSKETNGVQK